jgi:hypothetical protein
MVIRDFVGTTPLENLANTLKADLEKIWESLSKPAGLENCKITDYFDFMFTGLPHKILLPDKFDQEVKKLRSRYYIYISNYLHMACVKHTYILGSMIQRTLTLCFAPNIISVFLPMVTICMHPAFGIKSSPTKISICPLSKNYWHNTDVMKSPM